MHAFKAAARSIGDLTNERHLGLEGGLFCGMLILYLQAGN